MPIKKVYFIIILSFYFISLVYVRHINAFEQMNTYTVADGLASPVVPVIFQDSSGILWFGSDSSGVSRFDGEEFVSYAGNSQVLRGRTKTIVEDKWGNIWFLSKHPSEGDAVISRFNGTKYEYIADGTCLTVDKHGDIWVGGNNTVTRWTAINREDLPTPFQLNIADASIAKVNVIFQSRDGTFWIGGNDAQGALIISFTGDMNVWQTGNIKRHTPPSNLPQNRAIQVITQDLDDNLWFGGHSLLLRYDGTQFDVILNETVDNSGQIGTPQTSAAHSPGVLINENVTVKNDTRGRIWFSDNKQLRWWDGNSLRQLRKLRHEANQDNYLSGDFEIEDAWNKLWFSSETGAYLYDYKFFEEKPGIFELDSTFSDNTESGHQVYGVDEGLGSDNIQTIFESMDGKIWFGHDNGVTSFEPQPIIVNHTTRADLGSNSVRMIYSDSTGALWLSVPGGVAQYNKTDEKFVGTELNQFTFQTGNLKVNIDFGDNRRAEIKRIVQIDGDLWFLDKPIRHQEGWTLFRIYRYNNGVFNKLSLRIYAADGPGGDKIYSNSEILMTSGNTPKMVLGGWLFKPSRNGLLQLLPNGVAKNIKFGTAAFLPTPTDAITALHTDQQNRLWCYFETGAVQRYTNIGSTVRQTRVEVLPLKSVIPILVDNNDKNVNWFYNTVSGQLMYWENPDIAATLTELPGAANGMPLEAVRGRASELPPTENNKLDLMTFVFRDSIKTFQGAELKNAVSVQIEEVRGVLTAKNGDLWLATSQGAIRYNGVDVTSYTTADGYGFLVDDLRDVHEDNWGNIWFATWGGGVVRYDRETFQSITTKDGLIHNNVSDIHESNEEHLWFGTEGGATQYRASLGALPFCRIISVDAGKLWTEPFMIESRKHTWTEITELLPARLKNLTIHFQGISPLRDDIEYKFRLIGVDNNAWTSVTSEKMEVNETIFKGDIVQSFEPQEVGTPKSMPQVRYEGLKSGSYTFLIKAFREGWPYTQRPTVLNFTIDKPIWSRWRKYLPTLILFAAAGSLLVRLIVNQRRTAQLRLAMREQEEAEMVRIRDEINEAQNIQMALLPIEAPQTEGFDISGRSMPATEVGGDFFDYLTVENGQTAIAVADAAGKGIRGAMNAVLTNGMLHEVARFKSQADVILSDLNSGLSPRMYGASFIALNLAVLNESEKRVDYANGGQPYPVLKRGDEIVEIETSDLPLGSMKNVQYESTTFDLNEGDFLIFHSDGLIEALNAEQDMYGSERLNELIANIPNECSAEEVIEHIFNDVQQFVGEAEQYDDMTLVVVKRLHSQGTS